MIKNRIFRMLTYFKRGHTAYLAFAMSFISFIVIQYRLLIEYIPALKILFESLSTFAVIFFLIYAPAAIIIGWLDYKKGSVPIDQTISAQANPWVKNLAEALMCMCDGEPEKAKEILRKWVK